MKKIFLTIAAAALFGFTAQAQQQQDTTENNQYRRETNRTQQSTDTSSMNQQLQPMQDTTVMENDTTSNDAINRTEGEAGQQNYRQNRDSLNRTEEPTGQEMESDSGNNENQTAMGNPGGEIEVVESKEGPNNEVVYKVDGEMYYVDRETKQMVKADESRLKDSKHKVMIHEGNTTDATTKKTKKSKS